MRNPFRKIKAARDMLHDNGFHRGEAFRVFWDMLYCRKKFHCTYEEYFQYKFYNLRDRVRKNYLLRYHQRARYCLVARGNDTVYGKEGLYTLFHDMIKREWMRVTPENISEVEAFIRKHGKVIFKPNHGSQGSGIFAFTADEIDAHLREKHVQIATKDYLCEQYVIQHSKMSEMNPGSVNTVRVTTICDGKTAKVIFGSLRTGAGDGVCDNMSIGGVGASIDMETGILYTTGIDYDNKRYFYHPVTGTKILGFEIPYWKEVKEMVCACALRSNRADIVGWDIAITESGPCLIEANNRPAAGSAAQIATNTPQGEEIINYIDNNWRRYHKKIPKHLKQRIKRWG